MNSVSFRYLFVFFLLMSGLSTRAQNYFITNRNDTIRGELKMLTFGQVDQVVASVNGKRKTYKAMEVKSLYYEGDQYKPIAYQNSIHFFKLLKSGYVSYYEFRPANQMTYSGRYLAKIDGRGIEVPGLAFKKIMTNFMSDCPEIVEKLKTEELKRDDLDLIISLYNKCIEMRTAETFTNVAAVQTGNTKLEALKSLQDKVESSSTLASKKDVTDLLSDMADKIKKQQSIPNYQIEALKSLLKENNDTKEELEAVITMLGNN